MNNKELTELKKEFDRFLGSGFDKDNKSNPRQSNRWLFCWNGEQDNEPPFDCACCIADKELEGCGCICHKRVDQIFNFFLPHLKSNDEIKREAVEGFAHYVVNVGVGTGYILEEDRESALAFLLEGVGNYLTQKENNE